MGNISFWCMWFRMLCVHLKWKEEGKKIASRCIQNDEKKKIIITVNKYKWSNVCFKTTVKILQESLETLRKNIHRTPRKPEKSNVRTVCDLAPGLKRRKLTKIQFEFLNFFGQAVRKSAFSISRTFQIDTASAITSASNVFIKCPGYYWDSYVNNVTH